MYTIICQAQGPRRKELVNAISEFTGMKSKYLKVPSCAYQIGELKVNKEGNIELPDNADEGFMRRLKSELAKRGFLTEPKIELSEDAPKEASQPAEARPTSLVVDIAKESMNDKAISNLTNLLSSKKQLICHALGITDITFTTTDEIIRFAWFENVTLEEAHTYTLFISKLCELARQLKRVTGKERSVPNEKYAFRCFLLRLGFIGKEYKADRKILLQKLEGSAAFRDYMQ